MDTMLKQDGKKIDVPDPTMVITSSDAGAKIAETPVKPVLKPKTLLILVFVFVFVSIMIGILIWILQHEITKARTGSEGIEVVYLYHLFE